jgi:hypothetical protein
MFTLSPEQRLLLPAHAWSKEATYGPDGVKAVNILTDPFYANALGLVPGISGGARGFNQESDVIVATADGRDLNALWTEFQQTVTLRNSTRQTLIDFLTYPQTQAVEDVYQMGATDDFEVASEFGVPKSIRGGGSYFSLGFSFEWYDLATRFTWKFLAEATAAQVEAQNQAALEADNRMVFTEVMRTLFRNTNRTANINPKGGTGGTTTAYNVYAFYNNDGTTPPDYKANTFTNTHTHYLTSGAATVDAGDLEEMEDHLTHHGYSTENGNDLVLMVNKAQGDTIRGFRSVANGGTARYDFVPAQNTPSFLIPTTLQLAQGQTRPPATLRGMKVIGAYGQFTIVEESYVPSGYMVAFATGGSASLTNPVGIREHQNPQLRGLRLVKGRSADYPLQEAYYQRGFGTGIRQRGGGVVMKVTTGGYTIPTQYA